MTRTNGLELQLPDPHEVKRATVAYVPIAYPQALPEHVVALLALFDRTLANGTTPAAFYASEIFQRSPGPDEVTQYALRLGNFFYPHMKLLLIWSEAAHHYIFQVDTHDHHCCPPADAPDHAAFCDLMAHNQKVADEIEAAWDRDGMLTFKRLLREDLQRRQESAARSHFL